VWAQRIQGRQIGDIAQNELGARHAPVRKEESHCFKAPIVASIDPVIGAVSGKSQQSTQSESGPCG